MTRIALTGLLLFILSVPLSPARVVVISDDFEYTVSRTDSNAVETFQANGWTGAKTEGDGEPGANGWLYTVTSEEVPGGCATFPTSGSRVLLSEARPVDGGGQTDYYLQLGNSSNPAFEDFLPADLWVQFWVCNIDSGAMQSNRLNRNKFLYVCNGSYGCHTHMWMLSETSCNFWPPYSHASCGSNSPAPEFYWQLASAEGLSTIVSAATGIDPDSNTELGHNQTATPDNTYIPTNEWRLVKMNLNTSGATGRVRIWQAPPPGDTFTLVMDHQHGVNNLTYTYTTPRGHRELRMPSTAGHGSDPSQAYDYYMAMDDFTMAGSEGELPTYDAGGTPGGASRTQMRRRE